MSFDRQRAEEILAKHNLGATRKATAAPASRPTQASAAKIDVGALVEAGRLAGLAEARQRAQAILNTREGQANPLKAIQALARVELPNVKPAKFAALFADGIAGKFEASNRGQSALDDARCNALTAAIGRLSERNAPTNWNGAYRPAGAR